MVWISSKEFAKKYNINVFVIYKPAKRAHQKGKNFVNLSLRKEVRKLIMESQRIALAFELPRFRKRNCAMVGLLVP